MTMFKSKHNLKADEGVNYCVQHDTTTILPRKNCLPDITLTFNSMFFFLVFTSVHSHRSEELFDNRKLEVFFAIHISSSFIIDTHLCSIKKNCLAEVSDGLQRTNAVKSTNRHEALLGKERM